METTLLRTPAGVLIYKSTTTTTVNGVEVTVQKNACGWGGTVKAYTERPYAVFVSGKILTTAKGATRTFGTRAAATEAGIAAAKA